MKILCSADIHMGRIPSTPDKGLLHGHSSWDALVEKALELAVDVLLLAGDIVEHEDAWYEAYGPLLAGLQKLGEGGIQVIGVGGNHDWSIFPSLVQESPYIKVLGLGGRWESYDYKGVRFIGWSFPRRHVQTNPLESFDASLVETQLPLVGVLHADIATQKSNYAPCTIQSLRQVGIPRWVLGHQHVPQSLPLANAFYCGSPYALDSSERGEHGFWLLEYEKHGLWNDPVFMQLCPYRFEQLSVPLEGATNHEEVRNKLIQAMRFLAKKHPLLDRLYCSITLEGVVEETLDIQTFVSQSKQQSLEFLVEQVRVYALSPFVDATRLAVDLEKLSVLKDAKGLLAKKLLDPNSLAILVEQYKKVEQDSYNTSAFSLLEGGSKPKDDQEYEELVMQAAKKLLYSILTVGQEGQA